MTIRFFISYSRKDNTFAHRLAADLRAEGHTVWMDVSTLRAGQDWADEIDRAVRACDALILVVSPDSMKSEWVSKETILAMNLKKSVVPVMCRQTTLPVHLIDIQYIDFQNSYDEALQQLHQALSTLSTKSTGGPPPAAPAPRRQPPPPKRKWGSWLLIGTLLCCFLLAILASAGTIGWQMWVTPTAVVVKPTDTPTSEIEMLDTPTPLLPTPTPTDEPSGDPIIPDPTETDMPTPLPTNTSTPEPTNIPSPTPNPALGTFQTEFEESTEIVQLAFGPTLGGQAICKYHNITLTEQDVGKTLTAYIRDWFIDAPAHYTDVINLSLFRSQIGPWQAEQAIDLWNSPQAEPILTDQDEINWTITQPGNYIICLQSPVNTYYDPDVSFNWASFSVLLSGG